jgi:hypothetical protein
MVFEGKYSVRTNVAIKDKDSLPDQSLKISRISQNIPGEIEKDIKVQTFQNMYGNIR